MGYGVLENWGTATGIGIRVSGFRNRKEKKTADGKSPSFPLYQKGRRLSQSFRGTSEIASVASLLRNDIAAPSLCKGGCPISSPPHPCLLPPGEREIQVRGRQGGESGRKNPPFGKGGTGGFAFRRRMGCAYSTAITAVPDFLLRVAVMVALPFLTPVARPLSVFALPTFATFVDDDFQVAAFVMSRDMPLE